MPAENEKIPSIDLVYKLYYDLLSRITANANGDIRADGTVPFAANESMGGFKLTALADAVAATDAMNLQSVQALGYGVGDILADGSVPFTGGVIMEGSLETFENYTPTGRIIVPMGEMSYFDMVGHEVTINFQSTGSDNFVLVDAATALSANPYEFTEDVLAPGEIQYTGLATKMFHVASSISFGGSPNDVIVAAIAVNGAYKGVSRVLRNLGGGGDIGSTAIHVMVELNTGDRLSVYAGNTSTDNNITFYALNLFAMGM